MNPPDRYQVEAPPTYSRPLEVFARYPETYKQKTPLVFVHGACLDARCFDDALMPALAACGYEVHAVSLRYHETDRGYMQLNPSRIRDYVDDVWQVAQQFDTPPVLVGHSVGGYVAMKYIEYHTVSASILLSSIPVFGFSLVLYRTLKRYAVKHIWDFVSGKRNILRVSPDQFGTYCFTDDVYEAMPREKLEMYYARLHLESFLVMFDMLGMDAIHPQQAHVAPMLVLGALYDILVTPEDIQRTAAAYGAEWDVFSNMAHDICREAGSHQTVERMDQWLMGLALP